MKCAPVFKRESNKFLIAYRDYVCNEWLSAYSLGVDLAVEHGMNNHFVFDGEIADLDYTKGVKATLGDIKVLLIAGPLFDEIEERVNA